MAELAGPRRAVLCTDAKNIYDATRTPSAAAGKEKRVALEINLFKANALETKTEVAWVHSGSMLANSLTKTTEPQQLDLYYSRRCCWRITYDPEFWSAKRRQAAGVAPLDDRCGRGVT